MAKYPQVDFQITWRPFQLDSGASKEGVNKLQMYCIATRKTNPPKPHSRPIPT